MTNTSTTREIRRDDDELVGLLVCDGERWRPVTVFGASLAEPTDAAAVSSSRSEPGSSS